MEIGEEYAAEMTIVDVRGRIDSNTAKALADKLSSLINAGRTRIIVNLEHVEYISSAGFRVLLVGSRRAEEANGKLILCGLSADIQKLFNVTAFTDLFEIHPLRPV